MGDFFMKKEIEMLNFIFKNAEMGIIGIDDLIEELEDTNFLSLIKKQREQYAKVTKEARNLISDFGAKVEENSNISKVRSNLLVKMSSIKDKSIKKYAKMMIEGTNKGIIELQEKINAYNIDNSEIINLANSLLEIEENNIEELKKYL